MPSFQTPPEMKKGDAETLTLFGLAEAKHREVFHQNVRQASIYEQEAKGSKGRVQDSNGNQEALEQECVQLPGPRSDEKDPGSSFWGRMRSVYARERRAG